MTGPRDEMVAALSALVDHVFGATLPGCLTNVNAAERFEESRG